MPVEFSEDQRRKTLFELGADASAANEILERFSKDRWWPGGNLDVPDLPLDDEPHLEAWRAYAAGAQTDGAWIVLRDRLVQLAFPIREGISQEASYRETTLKGHLPPEGQKTLQLDQPDALSLELHPTPGGTVPVVSTPSRPDFERLIRALTARNEPIAISPAMGACLVNGLNNWDRIRTLRSQWETNHQDDPIPGAWDTEFRRIIKHPELYKDRLIILSQGPYSGVRADDVGFSEEHWNQLSFNIRMEHECTHAFSLRVFSALRHDLLEELIADWVALTKVFGIYRADLARVFLGLEDFPDFRRGGRLEVYRGDPPLSDAAFSLMQKLAWQAIARLEEISTGRPDLLATDKNLGQLILALSTLPTEAIAAPDGMETILSRLSDLVEGRLSSSKVTSL